ncbi:VOC family protein [Microbispora sp. CA-135349]|uniref:VOC family protein n=1 Tax=Microbispora sp. CA-135349 TaxID=3239953 RepID=UPI003D90FF96
MRMDTLFAGVAVEAFPGAVEWYARLFGRTADVVVADNEVMWRVADTAWLYVIEDAGRAGRSLVTISVSDLDQAVAELGARGISSGAIETVGDAGRKATVTDPEGNAIALIQIAVRSRPESSPSRRNPCPTPSASTPPRSGSGPMLKGPRGQRRFRR